MTILLFLLDTLLFALIAACLLRAWMNTHRISLVQQPGPFVMAVSDWLVAPLRRTLPAALARHRLDAASLLAAVLLALTYGLLIWLFWARADLNMVGPLVLISALSLLLRSALQLVLIITLAYAVLSWVQPHSPAMYTLGSMVDPLLRPLRRIIPRIGGVDLSALVLIVLAQVGLMAVGSVLV